MQPNTDNSIKFGQNPPQQPQIIIDTKPQPATDDLPSIIAELKTVLKEAINVLT